MKKIMSVVGGLFVFTSLWAANMGMVSVYGGYNAWVLGQLLVSEIDKPTNTEAKIDGGGFSFGVEGLWGDIEKTQFGLEVSWQPLFTMSGKDPTTGEFKNVGIVQIPVLGKVVFGGKGLYGSVGAGISFISSFGDKELLEMMKLVFTDPAFTLKAGAGFRLPLAQMVGFDVGADTTMVLGDYGAFKNSSEKPPVWLNMILWWQVGLRAGVSVYF
ncbi:MAG: hypothetical protein N2314_06750 [Brevinematales bacterium]|nr:hypothetical protein [Brevinematales bacterium]